MKESTKQALKSWAKAFEIPLMLILSGYLLGAGMRLAEWGTPAPETRIVVCYADEMYKVTECRSAADLLREVKP